MKKKTLALLLFISFVPFVFLREGDPSAKMDIQARGTDRFNYLPTAPFDTADLDARDAQNRPVNSAAQHQELSSLFAENLFNLIVSADPHNIQEALSGLELFSALFRKLIFNCVTSTIWAIQEALLPSKWRFVHNVGNLWISISVGIFLSFLLFTTFSTQRLPLRIILRC